MFEALLKHVDEKFGALEERMVGRLARLEEYIVPEAKNNQQFEGACRVEGWKGPAGARWLKG